MRIALALNNPEKVDMSLNKETKSLLKNCVIVDYPESLIK